MTSQAGSSARGATTALVSWLVTGAVGPALVALPVNLVAEKLCDAAVAWFKRLRQTDDLSRLVKAASGTSVHLSHDEVRGLRDLLKREQTWKTLAEGKLHEKLPGLTAQIAGCLPPRDGRSAEQARDAAGAIARGLIEFAVYDLQPEIFQRVVLARLRQMTDQVSELNEALLRMHKDLYQFVLEAKELFAQVMDRLPPGPADLNEIRIYLKTLISWLNNDPWPRDRRLGGPALTPSAIERKLRVGGSSSATEQDADELGGKCRRLVILGGPGSGKTWLAKRITRACAEEALRELEEGADLDEIELPLYTTCSRLFSAGGDIRGAVVSSALDQLGDLGGSRLNTALRMYFAERSGPTLLVIDSLDEAHGSDERLRQADTLPWRIVLTSQPSSWDQQLVIKEGEGSHRVGELQPLRYPDDVEPFIRQWFAERPEWGQDLAAQISRRPGLQQAATVPLVLAFYCIIGGSQPLPDFRRDLYIRVLKRMLTSRWRGSDDGQLDADTCLTTLRAWAWSAATTHLSSGVGTWADDFPTERVRLGKADANALDNVATPLGPADVDTGKTLRRFIHRSIREHLVAEHVASFPWTRRRRHFFPTSGMTPIGSTQHLQRSRCTPTTTRCCGI